MYLLHFPWVASGSTFVFKYHTVNTFLASPPPPLIDNHSLYLRPVSELSKLKEMLPSPAMHGWHVLLCHLHDCLFPAHKNINVMLLERESIVGTPIIEGKANWGVRLFVCFKFMIYSRYI